ncbi:MAG: FAD-binding protein [Ferrimicrobium sp.]
MKIVWWVDCEEGWRTLKRVTAGAPMASIVVISPEPTDWPLSLRSGRVLIVGKSLDPMAVAVEIVDGSTWTPDDLVLVNATGAGQMIAVAIARASGSPLRWIGDVQGVVRRGGPLIGLVQVRPVEGRIGAKRWVLGEAMVSLTSMRLVAEIGESRELANAAVVVGVGAGVSRERLPLAARLAQRIGGVVGATRAVTDSGGVDHDLQVGTTGVSIAPLHYVALGISGAAQHLDGIALPTDTIAVNVDPACAMMRVARYPFVADANAVLEYLVDDRKADGGC